MRTRVLIEYDSVALEEVLSEYGTADFGNVLARRLTNPSALIDRTLLDDAHGIQVVRSYRVDDVDPERKTRWAAQYSMGVVGVLLSGVVMLLMMHTLQSLFSGQVLSALFGFVASLGLGRMVFDVMEVVWRHRAEVGEDVE